MKRALLVAYAFPPVGGAGVQRSTKFVKYLPEFGWQVSVLTSSNPSVPLYDETLCADVSADTHIERARTFEPSYALKAGIASTENSGPHKLVAGYLKSIARSVANTFLQPDPQILWAPEALRRGAALLRRESFSAIVATGPPFSSFLIGERLSRWFGLPLVLDYRDEWDITNALGENRNRGSFSNFLQKRMQKSLLQKARAVVATTKASTERIAQIAGKSKRPLRLDCIYNGFDPSDFESEPPVIAVRERYRIVYVGTLWNLTSVAPLVQAIERLNDESPELCGLLELVFVGRRLPEQEALLSRLEHTACAIAKLDYMSHADAIREMYSADRLCVLLTGTSAAVRVVPAKVFEYFAAGRPILAIVPRGEVWELIEGYPDAHRVEPSEVGCLTEFLRVELSNWSPTQTRGARLGQVFRGRFSRPEQAKQLAEVLNCIASQAAKSISS